MIVIVACEPNENIRHLGAVPFLSTIWRASMMSYVFGVDGVCVPNEYGQDMDLDTYWLEQYQKLGVDYMSVDVDEPPPIRESKIARLHEIGAAHVDHYRYSLYFPTGLMQPELVASDIVPLSSSAIRDGTADPKAMQMAIARMFTKKTAIRDPLYGRRNWFG